MAEKHTRVWVIIDEEKLAVVCKYHPDTGERIPIKFEEQEDADDYARERLHMWTAFEVNFNHPWLHHSANYKWVQNEFPDE